MAHHVLHVLQIAVAVIAVTAFAAAAAVMWISGGRQPDYRKIDRLERQLGMPPSYDLSQRRRGR